jgi:hypothetical protein
MNRRVQKEGGLIGMLVLIIIALALLKYFLDWSVFEAAGTPQGHETLSYTKEIIQTVWSYLSVPFHFIWDKIAWPLLDLFWQTLKDFILFSKEASTSVGQ